MCKSSVLVHAQVQRCHVKQALLFGRTTDSVWNLSFGGLPEVRVAKWLARRGVECAGERRVFRWRHAERTVESHKSNDPERKPRFDA